MRRMVARTGPSLSQLGKPQAELPVFTLPQRKVKPLARTVPTACSFEEEWPRARRLRSEAVRAVSDLMRRAKLAEPLDTGAAEALVRNILDSVARNRNALMSLGRIRVKDRYTFEHSVNVAVLAGVFGGSLGIEGNELNHLCLGALLHDVGKAFTPKRILQKPAKLSDVEFDIMKSHVDDSIRVLSATDGIPTVSLQAASQHHERYDGSGYPHGLCGDAISLHGQIVGICDVYDAITADRCYRKGRQPTEVLGRMLKWGGTLFEPTLVQRFIKAVGIYPVGSLVGLESGRLAVVLERGDDSLRPRVRAFFDLVRKSYINPHVLDLSRDSKDRIVSYEQADEWKVFPERFMDEA